MAYIVTEVRYFDHKRNKVILDHGEVTFLLYKAECRRFGLLPDAGAGPEQEPRVLSEEAYTAILEEVLLPRAKKRALYYLKNADRTTGQISQKLREGGYPEIVIERTLAFLKEHAFADDARYAERYAGELKRRSSRREILAKLTGRGVSRELAREQAALISPEEEAAACTAVLQKKYPRGIPASDRQKAYAYLARRGFGTDLIREAFSALGEQAEFGEGF